MIKVLAVDPALLNVGLALATYDNKKLDIIKIEHIAYTRPKKDKSKADAAQVKHIAQILRKYCRGVDLVIAELPIGSQSAQAAWSLGSALGFVGSLDKEIMWVTANQVKRHTGNKTKREMIEWAYKKYPNLDWPIKGNRVMNSAQHVADSVGVLYTGLGIF